MSFTFDQWLSLAREFGVPIAILVPLTLALMWCILKILAMSYNAGSWIGQEFLLPIQKNHLDFLEVTKQTQLKQADTAEKAEATLQAIATAFRQHDEWERHLAENRDKDVLVIRENVEHLEVRVKTIEDRA